MSFRITICLFFFALILASCEKDTVEDGPVISVDVVINNNMAPAEVSFINNSSNADSFEWYFGDLGSSNETSPVHIFEQPGVFHVSLTARNGTHEEYADFEVIIKEPFRYKIRNNSSYILYNLNSLFEKVEKGSNKLMCSSHLNTTEESEIFSTNQDEIRLSFENASGVLFHVAFPFELKEDTLNVLTINNYTLLLL